MSTKKPVAVIFNGGPSGLAQYVWQYHRRKIEVIDADIDTADLRARFDGVIAPAEWFDKAGLSSARLGDLRFCLFC